MKDFVELYKNLDSTNSTNQKVEYLVEYLEHVSAEDAAWSVYLFGDGTFKRPVTTTQMREVTYRLAELPEWLFEDAYAEVGDLAETISLCLDRGTRPEQQIQLPERLSEWMDALSSLREDEPSEQEEQLAEWYEVLGTDQIFVLNKLIMGGLRVGVSTGLIAKAIAKIADIDQATVKFRLSGDWSPTAQAYRTLISADTEDVDRSRPYPYFLASPLEESPEQKGSPSEWLVEWKWDGMRGQLIKREGEVVLWSRGQELITETFPEIAESARALPDGLVLDGELLAWEDNRPMPFYELQRRIGRKNVSKSLMDEVPVRFFTYDLMEFQGEDIREKPVETRRDRLESLPKPGRIDISPTIEADTWDAYRAKRSAASDRRVEGLMLKRLGSPYRTGRKRGDWWKWKVEPYTIDGVLMYAKAGHGKRANLYSDLTFGVWRADGEIVPIAKAYSGLTDKQLSDLDNWIKSNTIERYGPVRSVELEHVFEIAFSGLAPSNRHKSGISLRFPRISRWRHDKTPKEANTLEDVEQLLDAYAS